MAKITEETVKVISELEKNKLPAAIYTKIQKVIESRKKFLTLALK